MYSVYRENNLIFFKKNVKTELHSWRSQLCEAKAANRGDKNIKAVIHIWKSFSRRHQEVIATITKETCTDVKSTTEVSQISGEAPYWLTTLRCVFLPSLPWPPTFQAAFVIRRIKENQVGLALKRKSSLRTEALFKTPWAAFYKPSSAVQNWRIDEVEEPQDWKLALTGGGGGGSSRFIKTGAKLDLGAGSKLAERALS